MQNATFTNYSTIGSVNISRRRFFSPKIKPTTRFLRNNASRIYTILSPSTRTSLFRSLNLLIGKIIFLTNPLNFRIDFLSTSFCLSSVGLDLINTFTSHLNPIGLEHLFGMCFDVRLISLRIL